MYGTPAPVPSGRTATTLILIGLIFQAVEVAILFGIGFLFLVFPFIGFIVFLIGGAGVLWLALVYLLSYLPAREANYGSARTPTLVFGILTLVTLSLIPGILYIVAYAKLGDAEGEAARPAWGAPGYGAPPPGWGAAPLPDVGAPPAGASGARVCASCRRPNPPGSTFCWACGARFA